MGKVLHIRYARVLRSKDGTEKGAGGIYLHSAKNGKTLFVAALAWALALLSVKSGATIYIVAAALRQAMESYRNIENNLTNHIYDSRMRRSRRGGEYSTTTTYTLSPTSISAAGPYTSRRSLQIRTDRTRSTATLLLPMRYMLLNRLSNTT